MTERLLDLDYHERRAAEERVRALAAKDVAVRDIHRELADRHAGRAFMIRQRHGGIRAV